MIKGPAHARTLQFPLFWFPGFLIILLRSSLREWLKRNHTNKDELWIGLLQQECRPDYYHRAGIRRSSARLWLDRPVSCFPGFLINVFPLTKVRSDWQLPHDKGSCARSHSSV